VDVEAAIVALTEFRDVLQILEGHFARDTPASNPDYIAANVRRDRQLSLICGIADRSGVLEASEKIRYGITNLYATGIAIAKVNEIIGHLEGEEQRNAILGPQGPTLAAATMHRWVWDLAAELWDNGHRREAVQAAATSLFDTQLPVKLGARSGNPRDLVSQAFSLDPPQPGKPRLRIPGYAENTPAWNDAHDGAKFLGLACVAGVRNLSTHTTNQPEEVVALEELAMLSRFARSVEDSNLET